MSIGPITEPVKGWRVFMLGHMPYRPERPAPLYSLNGLPIEPGAPAACALGQCARFQRSGWVEPGPSPHSWNREAVEEYGEIHLALCGYYAHTDESMALSDYHGGFMALAEVEGYGLVRMHETGWRAQYMRVLRLWVNEVTDDLRLVAAAHGAEIQEDSEWTSGKNYGQLSYPTILSGHARTQAAMLASMGRYGPPIGRLSNLYPIESESWFRRHRHQVLPLAFLGVYLVALAGYLALSATGWLW